MASSAEPTDSDDKGARPTTPPRISFGIEMEFMVAALKPDNKDPDEAIADRLPPVVGEVAVEDIFTCLIEYGIPAMIPNEYQRPKEYNRLIDSIPWATEENSWSIGKDQSIDEDGARDYIWKDVEIASPPFYAIDEAFEMVKLVANIIRNNFRTRTNPTCGVHVHVGNGRYRPDFRATRHFAALLWALDPLMSTMHCPTRIVNRFCSSNRMTAESQLASGTTAAEALASLKGNPCWAARYNGRARKLGEFPAPSMQKLDRRLVESVSDPNIAVLEPDWESDDSDWEDPAGKPFQRPRKKNHNRREIFWNMFTEYEMRSRPKPTGEVKYKEDGHHIEGGLPQVRFPIPDWLSKLSSDDEATSETSPETTSSKDAAGKQQPERAYPAVLVRKSVRVGPLPLDDILGDLTIRSRLSLANTDPGPITKFDTKVWKDRMTPQRKDAWSGIKELLSCDVGHHQLSFLMGASKSVTSNWMHMDARSLCQRANEKGELMTIEIRCANGTLDGEWLATWARIQCRLLEWSRDADPAVFMRMLGLLADQDGKRVPDYDFVDFLQDIGLYAEADICEKRLRRGAAAWYECLLVSNSDTQYQPRWETWSEYNARMQRERESCHETPAVSFWGVENNPEASWAPRVEEDTL